MSARAFLGDARHRRLVVSGVCRVEIDHISLRRVTLYVQTKQYQVHLLAHLDSHPRLRK